MFTPRLFQLKMHTHRVFLFKCGLPVFAFLLASLMLVWPALIAPPKEQFALTASSDKTVSDAQVDMEQVRFFARDDKNQPMAVTAPKVLETDPERQIITLYKPRADYQMADGTIVNGLTAYALYLQQQNRLLFEPEITATTTDGYRAVSRHVSYDNATGVLSGDRRIDITGPTGHLTATGFRIADKGDSITFHRDTDTTILGQKDGDIRVQSRGPMHIVQSRQTITVQDHVITTQQGKTITADKMELTYYPKSQRTQGNVKEIRAFGHVVASADNHQMTGDTGVYDPRTGIIVMTGHVVLTQGGNVIRGETATMNLHTGENTLTPTRKGQKKGRVRGHLIPAELKGTK